MLATNHTTSQYFPPYFNDLCKKDLNISFTNTFTDIHGKTKEVEITNKWIVPYNATLLKTFDAHINVTVVSTNSAVKYLYKYLLKGNSKVWTNLEDSDETKISDGTKKPVDQIKQFTENRAICPADATYQILSQQGFMQKFYNTYGVIRMPVHENDKIYATWYAKGHIPKKDLERTKLTEFFKFCSEHREIMKDPTHQFLYHEMPEHFVWDLKKKIWKIPHEKLAKNPNFFPIKGVNPRPSVGRMPFINPARNNVLPMI